MEVTVINEQNQTIAKISGEIDSTNVTEFEALLAPAIISQTGSLVLDCAEMSYISSAVLRVFLLLEKQSRAANRELIFKHVTPEILTLFKMTGFDSIFTLE